MKPYQVRPYKPEHLVGLLCWNGTSRSTAGISEKPQVQSLIDYCDQEGVKQLVYEPEYVDQFFSEDYSGYYARSFQRYEKVCGRLHLFGSSFTKAEFDSLLALTDADASELGRLDYRGFVVVKPLPQTIIGRTCLLPPSVEAKDRISVFPTLVPIRANLYGLTFRFESLPFQEQDREVAACATSALWTALYATAIAYRQHRLLSPLQITQLASQALPTLSRSLPNDGLLADHMISVVRTSGLECDLVRVGGKEAVATCQAYVAAYLRLGIPIVLSFDFKSPTPEETSAELHAVAVVGYRMKKGAAKREPETGFLSRATLIDQLSVHDDRVGPYSLIDLRLGQPTIVTSWPEDGGRKDAHLVNLTIPLHRQIRIPYGLVNTAVREFDRIVVRGIKDGTLKSLKTRPEWDIYLVELNTLRQALKRDSSINGADKTQVLTAHLPHFLWRAAAYVGAEEEPRIEFLFDATDLRQGTLGIRSVRHDEELQLALSRLSRRVPIDTQWPDNETPSHLFFAMVEHLASQPSESHLIASAR